MIVQSDAGYATQVSTKPSSICESSRNDWSLWSTSPAVTLPAHDEHAPVGVHIEDTPNDDIKRTASPIAR